MKPAVHPSTPAERKLASLLTSELQPKLQELFEQFEQQHEMKRDRILVVAGLALSSQALMMIAAGIRDADFGHDLLAHVRQQVAKKIA